MGTIYENASDADKWKTASGFTSLFKIWKNKYSPDKNMPLDTVLEYLKSEKEFGLFGENADCYFNDGTSVAYGTLWKAIRIMHNLQPAHCKTLCHVCPQKFIGATDLKYSKRRWRRMVERLEPYEYTTL